MLGWSDIAEEIRTQIGGQSSPDRAGDMVISRGNIGYQRSQDIEGSALAERFLQPDILGNLVEGDMTRPLDHHLDLGFPTTGRQFSQKDQFLNLGAICGIGQTSRAHPIAKTESNFITPGNLQHLIEASIERVLLLVGQHPHQEK